MIKIFGVSETTSDLETYNGDCVLIASKAVMHKYENGEYSLDLEASSEYSQYFEDNRLVVVDIPFQTNGMEFFRMTNIVKTRSKCKCKCYQVYNDMKCEVRPFTAATAYTCSKWVDLLTWMNSIEGGFIGGNGSFTIEDYTVGYQTDFPSQSFSFMGVSFADVVSDMIKKYGGYLYCNKRGFGVCKNRITTDRGINIRYGSNLKGITKTEDWSEVCTYLLAIGSAGIEKAYTNATQYTYKYNRIVKFQQDLNPENYQTEAAYNTAKEADLDAKAVQYFSEHSLPKINYTIDAYIENADNLNSQVKDIGDVINVIDEQLGVDILTTVLGFDYDLLSQRFTKIEFGNYANTIKGYNDRVKSQIGLLQENVTNISYPVGSIYQSGSSQNPHNAGMSGYWTLLSSSGGIYTWKRVS